MLFRRMTWIVDIVDPWCALYLESVRPDLCKGASQFRPVGARSDLFVWTDTCNVYVLRDGDAALLIDLGDGSVLDHLAEIGVRRVEWVLFTHHHREQCQGAAKLQAWKPQIAAPEAERALFEEPMQFRKAKPSLGDAHTVHGASYVRPPVEPIRLDRTFKDLDVFTWHGPRVAVCRYQGQQPGRDVLSDEEWTIGGSHFQAM